MTASLKVHDTTVPREPIRFLVFSASRRAASLNTRLARLAAGTIEQHGGRVDLGTMEEFDAPSYDEDVLDREGLPPGTEEFRRRLEANDAFVIASPEYNFSMPGSLKNAIDWVSRHRPQPFNERHGLLLSASPSMAGGNRGLWALRVPPGAPRVPGVPRYVLARPGAPGVRRRRADRQQAAQRLVRAQHCGVHGSR